MSARAAPLPGEPQPPPPPPPPPPAAPAGAQRNSSSPPFGARMHLFQSERRPQGRPQASTRSLPCRRSASPGDLLELLWLQPAPERRPRPPCTGPCTWAAGRSSTCAKARSARTACTGGRGQRGPGGEYSWYRYRPLVAELVVQNACRGHLGLRAKRSAGRTPESFAAWCPLRQAGVQGGRGGARPARSPRSSSTISRCTWPTTRCTPPGFTAWKTSSARSAA